MKKVLIIIIVALVILVPLIGVLVNTAWDENYMEHHKMYSNYERSQQGVVEVLVNVNDPQSADKAAEDLGPIAVEISEAMAKEKNLKPLNDLQNTLIGQIYGEQSQKSADKIRQEVKRIHEKGHLTPQLQEAIQSLNTPASK